MSKFAAVGSTFLVAFTIYKSYNYTNINYRTFCAEGNINKISHHLKQKDQSQESLKKTEKVEPAENDSKLSFYYYYSVLLSVKSYMQNNITFSSEDRQIRIYGYSVNQFIPLANMVLKLIYRNKPTNEDQKNKAEQQGPSTWYYRYLIEPFLGLSLTDFLDLLSIIHTLANPSYDVVSSLIASTVSQFVMQKTQPFVDSLMPIDAKYYQIFVLVLQFFKKKADEIEKQHKLWLENDKNPEYYNPVFEYIDVSQVNTYFNYFVVGVMTCFDGRRKLTEKAFKELQDFIWDWYRNSQVKSKY